jgi:hypothetical protein
VSKLQAECRNLSRPFLGQPTFWIGLGTLALSLGTNIYQYSGAERQRQLALIQTETLKLDAKKLGAQKAQLESDVSGSRVQLNSIRQEIAGQLDKLASLQKTISAGGTDRQTLQRGVSQLEQKAAALDNIAETAARDLARSAAPPNAPDRDFDKAAKLELEAFRALIRGDFGAAQRDFQASEDAANGFRYSYEWSRLLRLRQSELATEQGRKAVLALALSKGYATYAPPDVQQRLRQLAGE